MGVFPPPKSEIENFFAVPGEAEMELTGKLESSIDPTLDSPTHRVFK
jgi:hypothetical protein